MLKYVHVKPLLFLLKLVKDDVVVIIADEFMIECCCCKMLLLLLNYAMGILIDEVVV